MPDQDFLFALDMSGGPTFDRMLAELVRTVLGHIGYASSAIDALSGDHVAFEARAPAGTWMTFFEPSAAKISWMPTLLRMVSALARFAL